MVAVVAVVVVLAIAAGAYILLIPGKVTPTTSSTTSSGNTVSISMILNGQTSAGFYKNSLVTFSYTKDYTCIPALSKLFTSNQSEVSTAAAKTACGVGGGNSSAVAGSAPVFILVPAFAGLSIFGVPALGATSQGYPTFNGKLVFTQCGAGGTTAACSDHPILIYSPYFTAVEQHLGVKGGLPASLGGPLPEGVLPTPAHDHVVNYAGGSSIPWDVITVLVFDPNIMPDGATGQCQQWVTSDLSSPTANCLTSFDALAKAMMTSTTANANANKTQSDPIYSTLYAAFGAGAVKNQVLIPGVTIVTDNSPTNTNLFIYFGVSSSNPYHP